MPRKKKRSYGDYTTEIKGEIYASVHLPLGNGKYKRKVKLLEKLGGQKSDAVKWALAELDRHKLGETEKKHFTFYDLADWYKKEYLVAPIYKHGKKLLGVRTYRGQQVVLDRLCEYFGGYQVKKISVDVLRRYKRERLNDVSISSVNREFALMRAMFKKAQIRNWIRENPFDLGEKLIDVSLESPRVSPLTERIAKRLLARSRKSEQPLLHYLILVLKNTGARPSEIFPFNASEDKVPREPLIWKNILDFDFQAVRLISYKGRQRIEKFVPASLELEKGLRKFYAEIEPQPDDLLFPVKNFKRSWTTLCKSVKGEGVWLRDFRHYFNNRIRQLKEINDVERMLMLGQTELRTNKRYSTLDMNFVEKFRKATEIQLDTVQ